MCKNYASKSNGEQKKSNNNEKNTNESSIVCHEWVRVLKTSRKKSKKEEMNSIVQLHCFILFHTVSLWLSARHHLQHSLFLFLIFRRLLQFDSIFFFVLRCLSLEIFKFRSFCSVAYFCYCFRLSDEHHNHKPYMHGSPFESNEKRCSLSVFLRHYIKKVCICSKCMRNVCNVQ